MFTTMTFCERHGEKMFDEQVCRHIREKVLERIKTQEIFTASFYSEGETHLFVVRRYCNECAENYGLLAENQKYSGRAAEVKDIELAEKRIFTGVCYKCFQELTGASLLFPTS